MCPTDYLSGIFVDSDTQVACLSGYPAARANDQPSIQARAKIKEIVDRINGSPRLLIHANVRPDEGQVELDAMTQDAGSFPVAAWKTYPPATAGRGLDSAGYGQPFIERARQLGIQRGRHPPRHRQRQRHVDRTSTRRATSGRRPPPTRT